jgi:hypothetical protein
MACNTDSLFATFGTEVTWERPEAFHDNLDKAFTAISVTDATVILNPRATGDSIALGYAANTETGTVTIPAVTATSVRAGDRFIAGGIRRRLVGIGQLSVLFGTTVYEYESEVL